MRHFTFPILHAALQCLYPVVLDRLVVAANCKAADGTSILVRLKRQCQWIAGLRRANLD